MFSCGLCFVWGLFQFVVGAFLCGVSFCIWCEKFFVFPFFPFFFLMMGIGLCGIPKLEFFFFGGIFLLFVEYL